MNLNSRRNSRNLQKKKTIKGVLKMIRFFLTGILMQTPILSTTSEGTAISEFDIAIKREHSQNNETDIFKTDEEIPLGSDVPE